MPFTRHIATALGVMLAASAQLVAQGTPAVASQGDPSAPASAVIIAAQAPAGDSVAQAMSYAPTAENAQVGVRARASSVPVPMAPYRDHLRNSETMMIVGGAVLIVGAVIGGTPGTIIMIGGGAIGIVGLIRYLQ